MELLTREEKLEPLEENEKFQRDQVDDLIRSTVAMQKEFQLELMRYNVKKDGLFLSDLARLAGITVKETEMPMSSIVLFYTEEELRRETVNDLKEILTRHGIKFPKSGMRKDDYISAILKHRLQKPVKKLEEPEALEPRAKKMKIEAEELKAEELKAEELKAEELKAERKAEEIKVPEELKTEEVREKKPEEKEPEKEKWTESDLQVKTVKVLKEILKPYHVTVPRLKADIIAKILEEEEKESKKEEEKIVPEPKAEIKVPEEPKVEVPEPKAEEKIVPEPKEEIKVPEPKAEIKVLEPKKEREPYTEEELKLKTVVQLKQILKENGLSAPKLKSDIIDRILENKLLSPRFQKSKELKAEELKAEELKAEEPKIEELKAEELKAEEPKKEEKVEELKAEEPKKEEKVEELKAEPKIEESKEELKAEESKKEENVLYTSDELKIKTVVQLKEILKKHGITAPRLKSDIINRILENKIISPEKSSVSVGEEKKGDGIHSAFDLIKGFDPFDFNKYPEDYKLLSQYYQNEELYISLAIWNLYKYIYLPEQDREKLNQQVLESKNPKNLIDELTSAYQPDQLLAYWYLHFGPEKATVEHVNKITTRYTNHYEELWKRLYKKYVTARL